MQQGMMLEVSKARRAIDKKARRKASRAARADGLGIERVIRHSASSPIGVGKSEIDMAALYHQARKDMGKRVTLTGMWHSGNAQAGKARRALNDWELATDPAGPTDAWQEDSDHKPKGTGRRAAGKCDVQSVSNRNNLKRNGATYTR